MRRLRAVRGRLVEQPQLVDAGVAGLDDLEPPPLDLDDLSLLRRAAELLEDVAAADRSLVRVRQLEADPVGDLADGRRPRWSACRPRRS